MKEKFIKKEFFYKGRAVSFRVDRVKLPNKKEATREYLDHPGAVGLVALTKTGKLVMVRQYRHPVGKITWEIPAGKIDRGEDPKRCAVRELEEETGYRASSIKKFLSFWPTAAFANEVIHIYLARGLKPGPQRLDDDEFLGVFEITFEEGLKAIRAGKIKDSKTMIAILSYAAFERGRTGGLGGARK